MVAVALVLLAVLLVPRSGPGRDLPPRAAHFTPEEGAPPGLRTPALRPTPHPVALPASAHALPAASVSTPTGQATLLPPSAVPAPPPPGYRLLESARMHRLAARFPPDSGSFDRQWMNGQVDPIAADYEVAETRRKSPNYAEDRTTVVVWPEQRQVDRGEPGRVFASVLAGAADEPAEPHEIHAVVDYQPGDDQARDSAWKEPWPVVSASAGVYVVEIPPERIASGTYYVAFTVSIQGTAWGAGAGFSHHPLAARVTGRFRDWQDAGHLYIAVEVEAVRAATVFLQLNLYDAKGEVGVAQAHNSFAVKLGRQELTMRIWGKILHDAALDGPWLLKYLQLRTSGVHPHAFGPLYEKVHRTRAYRASSFSGEPYNDPDYLAAAARDETAYEEMHRAAAAPSGPAAKE